MEESLIERKIEEQGKILEALVEQNKKTQRTLNWLRAIGIIKILVILAPIILAIIYLPPFVKKAIEEYQDVIPGLEKIQEMIEEKGADVL